MDITQAKRVMELAKPGSSQKILITLWRNDTISSCVEEETKKYCETCQCDDETCQDWIDHLKEKGYQATEIELGEFGLEESLPKFLEERVITVKPKVVLETEVIEHAEVGTVEAVPGSPGELQPGESEGSSPETS